jgi:hypothetical protein
VGERHVGKVEGSGIHHDDPPLAVRLGRAADVLEGDPVVLETTVAPPRQ